MIDRSSETVEPKIKYSKHPDIQKRVDIQLDELSKKHPSASTPVLNQMARDKVANQLARERLKQEVKRAEELSMIDPLTGLYNRRWFDGELVRQIAEARRTKKQLWVIMMDIDDFDQINNQYGHHPIGDKILQAVAKIRHRQEEPIARMSGKGDEFAEAVNEKIKREDVKKLLRRYAADFSQETREILQTAHPIEGINLSEPLKIDVTISIGATRYVEGDTPMSLLTRSDSALYRTKNAQGKGESTAYIAEAGNNGKNKFSRVTLHVKA